MRKNKIQVQNMKYIFNKNKKLWKVSNKIKANKTVKTAQKTNTSLKYFFSKCDQIQRKLQIWSHLL